MPSQDLIWAKNDPVYECDNLLFRKVRYAADHGHSAHSHGQTHLIFFLRGTAKDFRKQQTFVRTPATLILIPPDEIHSTLFLQNVHTFEIVLSPSWAERLLQASLLPERPLEYQSGSSIEIVSRLYREFQTRDNLTPLMMEGLMLELLAQMSRDSVQVTGSRCPRWLRETNDFLHAHFAGGVSLEVLAAEAGVHPSHLIRTFRQHFHCSIGDYIRQLRIQQARHDLSSSETPLSEIALAVGYSDQSHFTNAFKRQTGLSPGQYRKIYRKS